jgi:hypothetical protein
VREKSIEAPVEEPRSNEGVDVANVEPAQAEMLAWLRLSGARSGLAASSLRARRFRGEGRAEAYRC